MKKLLSICFLSMLLALAGFTANAQCCFWLENLQPETVADVSNLGLSPGTNAAHLPGQGATLTLSNNLSKVNTAPNHQGVVNGLETTIFDRVDWYQLHVGNCGNANTKVSLEWKLYRDGVLLTDADIRDYADIYIYTKFDEWANTNNVNATCGHRGWLGGLAYGPGVCRDLSYHCQGGYPGSTEVDNSDIPYSQYGFSAAGYVRLPHTYNLDYFYLGFLQSTTTRIAINWKQVGNYALVVGLRERTNGTDFAIWSDDNQNAYIGGHQSCCGSLIASDSLTYPVFTNNQYAICDGETYSYGKPAADYTVQGNYNVLFGNFTCDHWEVDSIDALTFYTRINPNIAASDLVVCKNDVITVDQIKALAPAVNLDAPGYVGHKIFWRKGTEGDFYENISNYAFLTNVPGVYTFQVYQSNNYDAVTGQDFWCDGEIATFTVTVLDVLPPVLKSEDLQFCYSELPQEVTLSARLNNTDDNTCADNIHWFLGEVVNENPVYTGALEDGTSNYTFTIPAEDNVDKELVYSAFSYDASTETYSTTGVSVKINIWKNPVLVANTQNDSIVKCPLTENIELNSNFESTNFDFTELDWTYSWTKNGAAFDAATQYIVVTAPGCDEKDVYVVTAVVKSIHGCEASISRRFTVEGVDRDALAISWTNSSTATQTLYGCDTTSLFEGAVWMAPFTMEDVLGTTTDKTRKSADEDSDNPSDVPSFITIDSDHCSNVNNIVYAVEVNTTAAPCSTIVTRSYKLVDACGNESNTINQVVTIINNQVPTIEGDQVELAPVRPFDNDCKSNLPARAALLVAFNADFDVTTGCDAVVADDNISFFMGNTDVVADGNLDIFANTDQVVVYAQVKDACGNTSVKNPVFYLNKPRQLDINHGAITISDHELCNTESATVVFDPLMIQNGLAPYQYTWSQTPADQCSMLVSEDNLSVEVAALRGDAFNTTAQFVITIKDQYGCVTTDTSNAINWFGIPEVSIVEATINDDYPHAAPVVVCPTFGHYLLKAEGISNIPSSAALTYQWSGEAIDHTSTTENCFIAVNENICERVYEAVVEVTNAKGCKAIASYEIKAEDTEAPVITLNKPTDTIYNLDNCKIIVPDYTTLFTPATVSDNCWNMDSTKVTQSIAAGTKLSVNTDVVITVAPKCGPAATYTIKACFPEPRISTEIHASVDSTCFPYTTVFTANTSNFVEPLNIYWDGATVADERKEFTTGSETADLTHNVRVVDANGCEAEASYTLVVYHTPVAADATVATTPNHFCDADHADGTFTVSSTNDEINGVRVSGSEEWHALPYTAIVPDGTYTFDLRTIHNCVSTNIITAVVAKDTVDANLNLNLAIITDNANCVAPWSGTIQVNNPVAGYTYSISAGEENSGDQTIVYDPTIMDSLRFIYLYQGEYTISVVSTFNCHSHASIVVNDHRETPEIPAHEVEPNTNCINPNGEIVLNNTNTEWYYTINSAKLRGNNGNLYFGNLAAGDYILTIINEGTRCSVKDIINVANDSGAPQLPHVTVTPNTYCVGSNGSIKVDEVVEGLVYTLTSDVDGDGDVVATTLSSSPVLFSNLAAGSYNLEVFNTTTGCKSDVTKEVENETEEITFEEIAVTPNNACDFALANGTITGLNAEGFTYVVTDNEGNVITDLTHLFTGVYNIKKTNNETGCFGQTELEVNYEEIKLQFTVKSTPDMDCSDEIGTGSIVITPASVLTQANFWAVNQAGEEVALTNLNAGFYSIRYTVHSTGCDFVNDTMREVKADYTYPEIVATATANYNCKEEKNGSIIFSDNNTTGNYSSVTFSVNDEVATSPLANLNSGTYTISAITNYHCATTDPFTVTVEDSAFVVRAFAVTPNSVCNVTASKPGNGSIKVLEPQSELCDYEFTNLTTGRHYDVNHFEPVDYTKYTLEHADYRIRILDNRTGCSSVDAVTVPFAPIDVNIDNLVSTPDYICTDDLGNGTITVTASCESSAAVLEYSIDGTNFQAENIFTNVDAGEYHIYIKNITTDCRYDILAGADVTVKGDTNKIVVNFNNTPNTACDPTLYNGAISYTVAYDDATLGESNFSVSIAGGSFVNLNGGNYEIQIHDNLTGCDYKRNTIVENENEYTPNISIISNNRNQNPEDYHFCYNQTDATLLATATTTLAGDTNFTYTWHSECNHIDPNGALVNVYTGQAFCCMYTVTAVSNLTGCSNTEPVRVCIDTLPVIRFSATGDAIAQTTATPNVRYTNCVNNAFTMCVVDPGFQSIVWTNGHTGTDACFDVPANSLTAGEISYCVKVVDNNGCASGPEAVNVTTLPIATTVVDTAVCEFFNRELQNGTSVNWDYNPEEGASNVYTFVDTFSAVNGCDSIVTYHVTINTHPSITVDINLTEAKCAGSKLINDGTGYTAENAINAGWRIVDAGTTQSINAGEAFDTTAVLDYAMNGKHIFAYAMNSCDTVYTDDFLLTVIDKPSLADGDKTLTNNTICLGDQLSYDASCIHFIDWHGAGSADNATVQYTTDGGANWATVPDAALYPNVGDDFKVRIIAKNSCSDIIVLDGPVTITVKDTTKLAVNGDTTQIICLGDSIKNIVFEVTNATASVSDDLLPDGVSFDPTTNTISGKPTQTGTFKYVVTTTATEGHCDGEVVKQMTGTITINDTVQLSAQPLTQVICLGEEIEDIAITYSNATYTTGDLIAGLSLNSETNKISGTPTTAGNYSITIKAEGVCNHTNKTLNAAITVKDTTKLAVNGDTTQIICLGDSIKNIVFEVTNATASVSENGLPAGVTFNSTTNTISGTPTEIGTFNYVVTTTATDGYCDGKVVKQMTGTITINDTVQLSAQPLTQEICLGEEIEDIVITYSNATVDFVDLTSGLSASDNNHKISGTPTVVGNYTITINATSVACPNSNKTLTVAINVNDTAKLSVDGLSVDTTQSICLGESIQNITFSVVNATASVSVDDLPAGVTFNSTTNTISGTPTESGIFKYVVTATNEYGCNGSVAKTFSGTITVNDTVKVTVDSDLLNQTLCAGDSITEIVFDVQHGSLEIEGDHHGIVLSNDTIKGIPSSSCSFNVIATSTESTCGKKYYSINLTLKYKPDFTEVINDGDLKVCVGDVFGTPSDPSYNNGGLEATTRWSLLGAEFDFTTPTTLAMNGKELLYIATNACGSDTVRTTVTVDTLPVPQLLSDTVVCPGGTATLSTAAGYTTYQWYNGTTEITGFSSHVYQFNPITEGTYHFHVVVTDGNGCVSEQNVNASNDVRHFAVDSVVTVIVNGNPGFIFKQNGVETHEISATTDATSTNYTWQIANPCEYDSTKLVFVSFDIYYNDTLLENSEIGNYIVQQTVPGTSGLNTQLYVTSDQISWNSIESIAQNAIMYYNAARSNRIGENELAGNHFPLIKAGSHTMDCYFIHFLNNRVVTKTINQFRKSGDYRIEYRLIATSHENILQYLYHGGYGPYTEATAPKIGGANAFTNATFDTLAFDVFNIFVTGEDKVVEAPEVAPMPSSIVDTDNATMEVYPNPAQSNGEVKARIQGITGNTSVRIVNLAGKVVAQENIAISTPEYLYTGKLNNLVPGVYFIYVQGKNATISKKLVITK